MLSALPSGPILWLPLTIAVYYAATELQRRAAKSPLANPTLLTIGGMCGVVLWCGVPHATYFEGVAILHYLLGTAVVALAIPLHRNLRRLNGDIARLAIALLAGSLSSILAGVLIAAMAGASSATLLSLAPKSATAAVSMEIARSIGGVPAMTACLTILTGIIGAVLGPYILTAFGVKTPAARGLALGTVSHGIATARAFDESELSGCWASLAMALNALLTALLVPPILVALGLLRG